MRGAGAPGAGGAGSPAEPRPTEHDQVRWLAADELDDVDWLEPDRPFLAELARVLGIIEGVRGIFFEEEHARAVARRLAAEGYDAAVVRERLAGEDDDEDHPWAVLTDAPEMVLDLLVDEYDGWLDPDDGAGRRRVRPGARRSAAAGPAGCASAYALVRPAPPWSPSPWSPSSCNCPEMARSRAVRGAIRRQLNGHGPPRPARSPDERRGRTRTRHRRVTRLLSMSNPPDHRLLLVHAHPDDETIGQGATMAKYVAEGRGVTLVTCTAGEMGEILVPGLEHLAADQDDSLGVHRREELAAAMKELGVTDHRWLGGFGTYRDSGMKWHDDGHAVAADEVHDNAFWHADLTEAADHLVAVLREVRPQVVVTYDEFGGYGHPDHIQAHRVATYAVALAAVPSYRRDLGEPWDVAKVYWGAMSESRMRAGLRALRDSGDTTTFEGMDPDGPLPPFITPDENLSAAVDATDHVDQKMAALAAHATQITTDGPFFALSNNVGSQAWGVEFYRIAKGRARRARRRRVRDRSLRRPLTRPRPAPRAAPADPCGHA